MGLKCSVDPHRKTTDPYILTGIWIATFRAFYGSLYSERSMNPYNSESSVDPFIFDRSVDLYILAGTWFPIFWPVHGFLYSQRYPRYSHYENDSFYLIGVDMTYLTFTIPFNL